MHTRSLENKHFLIFLSIIILSFNSHEQTIRFEIQDPALSPQPGRTLRENTAVSDINGDGYQDLVFGRTFYINDGNGGFYNYIDTTIKELSMSCIAFADIDGDGKEELFITGQDTSSNRVALLYKNDGNGNFTEVPNTPFIGTNGVGIRFADVTGNGAKDVLTFGRISHVLTIPKLYINDGNGNFTEETNTPFENSKYTNIAFGDLNGNGHEDIITTGTRIINNQYDLFTKIYLNDGNGIFSEQENASFETYENHWSGGSFNVLDLADIDGDGDLDLIIGGSGTDRLFSTDLYANDGNGYFTKVNNTHLADIRRGGIAFNDVDNDGDMDLIISGLTRNSENTMPFSLPLTKLYENDGAGNFSENTNVNFHGVSIGTIVFIDINNNGYDDIFLSGLAVNNNYQARTYLNKSCFQDYATDTIITCGNEYTWIDGNTYNSSNHTAQHYFTNIEDCDSIVTLNLTLIQDGIDYVTACDSFTWIDGNTYTESNNSANYVLSNIDECDDQIVTLDLTLYDSQGSIQTVTACDEYTWIDGLTYNASTTSAKHVLTSVNGCDSIIKLNLTINHSPRVTETVSSCGPFTWINGNTYTTTTSAPTYTYPAANGCDSIVRLNLTVNEVPDTDVDLLYKFVDGSPYLRAAGGNDSYQWLDCNDDFTEIQGETSRYFHMTEKGSYAVEVSLWDCTSISDCIVIDQLSLDKSTQQEIKLYPNPTTKKFTLEVPITLIGQPLTVTNAVGETILKTHVASEVHEYILNDLSKGIYFVRIETLEGFITNKLIVE